MLDILLYSIHKEFKIALMLMTTTYGTNKYENKYVSQESVGFPRNTLKLRLLAFILLFLRNP